MWCTKSQIKQVLRSGSARGYYLRAVRDNLRTRTWNMHSKEGRLLATITRAWDWKPGTRCSEIHVADKWLVDDRS